VTPVALDRLQGGVMIPDWARVILRHGIPKRRRLAG
jgi:hypothetical protein